MSACETFLSRYLKSETSAKKDAKIKIAHRQPISLSLIQKKRKDGKRKTSKKLNSKETKIVRKKFSKSDLEGITYEQFKDLNELHTGYMEAIFQKTRADNTEFIGNEILKADLHGAKLEVLRSKCKTLVGKKGFVVMETKHTFRLIQEDSKLVTIPKKASVFSFKFKVGEKPKEAVIFGDNFCLAPGMRIIKKFKNNTQIPII